MTDRLREFHSANNGDTWFVGRDAALGAFVLHKANKSSGGAFTHLEIGMFLSGNLDAPECRALLELIGTLVDETPAAHSLTLVPDFQPHGIRIVAES